MDPDYEQRLREEVIYLHSLWHQGPPRIKTPNPNPTFIHPIRNPTQFKKRGNRSLGNRSKIQTQYPDSGIKWPCNVAEEPPPPVNDSGWPIFRVSSNSERRPLTPEEQARLGSSQAQKAALKAVSKFLSYRVNADDEDEDEDSNDTDGEGCGKFEYFVKLFEDDSALREYYEKNNAGGEFSCLVCFAEGKWSWKRYKDCVALVQHSVSINKTKSRQAHRAYGQAICKLLGWDINRLPSSIISIDNKDKDALNLPSSNTNTELLTTNGGTKESANNENSGANNGEYAPLEGNIDNHVKDEFKLRGCINNLVNVNTGEVPLQNESTNSENLQDNVGSKSAALEEPANEDTGVA